MEGTRGEWMGILACSSLISSGIFFWLEEFTIAGIMGVLFLLLIISLFLYGQSLHPFRTSKGDPDEDCPICLQRLEKSVVSLPCEHLYHLTCISTWFQRKRTCPICARVFE